MGRGGEDGGSENGGFKRRRDDEAVVCERLWGMTFGSLARL